MDDFERELKLGFLEEATQLLSDVEQAYLNLESNPSDASIIDQIFRVAHNLKGSSKAVGFDEMGAFAHEFEFLLLKIKNGELTPNTQIVNLLLHCNDHISVMVSTLRDDMSATFDSADLLVRIKSAINGELSDESGSAGGFQEEAAPYVPDADQFGDASLLSNTGHPVQDIIIEPTVPNPPPIEASPSLSIDGLEILNPDDLLPENKQAASANPSAAAAKMEASAAAPSAPTAGDSGKNPPPAQPPANSGGSDKKGGGAANAKAGEKADESIRVSLARLEKLLNYVGEMVILQTVLKEQTNTTNVMVRRTVHQLGKVTKEVQDISMSLRMIPLKQTFQKMQRIVRDTTNALGKKVNLVLEGEETELDKTVLENISDPLVHLIRNACDHGIETPEKRAESGKSSWGSIKLSAYHQSGKLVIEVKDDGGGINADVLRKKAVEKGILKPGQTISEKDAIHLIFHPGFSTKAQVTDVSGRGVGMDVVKTNIEALQGEVIVETEIGKGTTFKVVLPLTLAIIDAMVVRIDNDRFVIPLSHVHESLKPQIEDLKYTTGIGEVLMLRGENLPLFRLHELLGRRGNNKQTRELIALVIRSGQEPFAILVDDIIGQHQVVIKKLGDEIQHIKGFAGSAILGDGKPSLILEVPELVARSGAGKSPSGAGGNHPHRPNDVRGAAA